MKARAAAFVALLCVVGCRPKSAPTSDGGTHAVGATTLAATSFRDLPFADADHDGVKITMRSGYVASFDGLPLAVDLTLPRDGKTGPRPLVVFFHGWTEDRKAWQSTTRDANDAAHAHFNQLTFAARGYAVLNVTIRGWHDSCGPGRATVRHLPTTLPPDCRDKEYWVHVADPKVEIRDAQHLIARLVDDGFALPDKIGIVGGSYGGAHAWMLALAGDEVTMPDGARAPWKATDGRSLHVAAVAPLYTWSSLLGALLPNGRVTDRDDGSVHHARSPVGVPLGTYLTGFFAGGPAAANGYYATPTRDASSDFTAWFARFNAGPPFIDDRRIDAILHRALDELERRSPEGMPVPKTRVPVFQVQGLTDPLFPAVHALVMRNKVLAADATYPITTFLGDVGHASAQNPRADWDRVHPALDAFFDHWLKGEGTAPASDMTVSTTTCGADTKEILRGPSFHALAKSKLSFKSNARRVTTTVDVNRSSFAIDPLLAKPCKPVPVAQTSLSAWTFEPGRAVTLVGSPEVVLTARFLGNEAPIFARVWDVAGETQTLVSRGAYRWVAPSTSVAGVEARLATLSTQRIAFQTSATAWALAEGHRLKLEIVGYGAPEHATTILPATITIESVDLTIPTRD